MFPSSCLAFIYHRGNYTQSEDNYEERTVDTTVPDSVLTVWLNLVRCMPFVQGIEATSRYILSIEGNQLVPPRSFEVEKYHANERLCKFGPDLTTEVIHEVEATGENLVCSLYAFYWLL